MSSAGLRFEARCRGGFIVVDAGATRWEIGPGGTVREVPWEGVALPDGKLLCPWPAAWGRFSRE